MHTINNTFRLFVSSTFSDFSVERRLLQEYVFPKLKTYCVNNNLNFQAIDLRWGVSNEAQLDQKTLELCLEEVKTSKLTPYPNFLIMAGDRYGWIPIPYMIDENEFELILKNIETKEDIDFLNRWYKLDYNQIPSSYILQERTKEYVEYTNWEAVENGLRQILQKAVSQSNLSEAKKSKYYLSATEHEVIEGIFKYYNLTEFQKQLLQENYSSDVDSHNIYGYIRNISNIANEFKNNFIDESLEQVTTFKKEIKNSINKENILEVEANLSNINKDINNGSLDYIYEAVSNEKESIFVKTIFNNLKKSVDLFLEKKERYSQDELDKLHQENFKNNKLKNFIGREDTLNKIDEYINSKDEQALIIYGKSGLGKTAIISKSIDNSLKKYNDYKIIYKFIGSNEALSSSQDILISILKEFNIIEDVANYQNIDDFYYTVAEHFRNITQKSIIYIDAIDQLTNKDVFIWLPTILPVNLKIIISALEDDNYKEDSEYFKNICNRTSNLHKLPEFNQINAINLVKNILQTYNRTVTDEQMAVLMKKYENIKSPLYLVVACQEMKNWKSSSINKSIADTQRGVIKDFIDNLSKIYHHDEIFVSKVFAYIHLTSGLSESELLEILSTDDKFINYIAPETFHKNTTKELPIVIWSRLYNQIKDFLKFENVENQKIMTFFHREFEDVISISQDEHKLLIKLLESLMNKYQNDDFYSNRWAKLYLSVLEKYHLKYEFDYEINEKSEKSLSINRILKDIKSEDYLQELMVLANNLYITNNERYQTYSSFFYSKYEYLSTYSLFKSKGELWGAYYSSGALNYAINLSEISRNKSALEISQIAYIFMKKVYKEEPKFVDEYLEILEGFARIVEENMDFKKASELYTEYYNTIKDLYDKSSGDYQLELDYLVSLNKYIKVFRSESNNLEELKKLGNEALNIAERLFSNDNAKHIEYYVHTLNTLTDVYISAEDYNQALYYAEKSIKTLKPFYEKNKEELKSIYTDTLENLTNIYAYTKKNKELIKIQKEKLDIYQALYLKNNERWLTEYTLALEEFSQFLNENENPKEALKYIEEASNIVSPHISSKESKVYLLSYISLSIVHSEILHNLGKTKDAIKILKELIKITSDDVERYIEHIFAITDILATIYNDEEKYDEEIKIRKYLLDISKKLYEKDADKYISDYKEALISLAFSYDDNYNESLKLYIKAKELLKPYYDKNKEYYVKDYAEILQNIANCYAFLDYHKKAIDTALKLVDILKIVYNDKDDWAKAYANSLRTLANAYLNIEKYKESLKLYREAEKIYKSLLLKEDKESILDYHLCLYEFADSLNLNELFDESVKYAEKALDLIQPLVEEDLYEYADSYLNNLRVLSQSLYDLNKTDDVLEVYEDIFEILKILYDEEPDEWGELYEDYLSNLKEILEDSNISKKDIETYLKKYSLKKRKK